MPSVILLENSWKPAPSFLWTLPYVPFPFSGFALCPFTDVFVLGLVSQLNLGWSWGSLTQDNLTISVKKKSFLEQIMPTEFILG